MSTKHYVVRTKPCHEAIARANLIALGFDAYVPTVREDIRTRFTRTTTLAPMFPGYIFVSLELADPRWREATHAKGVVELLPRSDHPTPVPERAMQWVRESEAAENAKRAASPVAHVAAGDAVVMTRGSFEGHSGICQASRGERVRVLLTIMGVAAEVDVRADGVKRRTA
jgi:transcriptional antiterminator RfaH